MILLCGGGNNNQVNSVGKCSWTVSELNISALMVSMAIEVSWPAAAGLRFASSPRFAILFSTEFVEEKTWRAGGRLSDKEFDCI